jgi:hypothetical protein
MLKLCRDRSKVRRSRSKFRRSRSKVRRSRSKVRRSRAKVGRSRSKVSRSKVRRSRSKVSRRKRRNQIDGVVEYDDYHKSIRILNSDINNSDDPDNSKLKTEIIESLKTNKIKSPYKIVYESDDYEVLTDINESGEQKNIFDSFSDPERNRCNILVSSGKFSDKYKENIMKKWNERECGEFSGGPFCNSVIDNNNLRRCRTNQKTKLCEQIPEEYRKNATYEFIGKVIEKPNTQKNVENVGNKKEETTNLHNSKAVTRTYKISLLESIAKNTGISVDKLKIILGGISTTVLASILFYLSKNNKNMSKEEMKYYILKIANKNKK